MPEITYQEPCGARIEDKKGTLLGFCTRAINHYGSTPCTHLTGDKPPVNHDIRHIEDK